MQEYWRSILRGLKPEIRDSLTLEKALVNREGTRLMVCFHAPGLIVGDDYNDIKRSVRAAFPGREVAVRVSCPELKEQVERDITPYWEFIKNCVLRQLPACKPFFRHCTISQTGTSVTVNFPDEAVIAFMLNCKASELLSKLCRELFQANITFDFTCSGEMDERLRYISEMRKKDEQLLMERLALEQKANAKTQAEKKPELPQVLYGRSIDTAPMQIDQIAEDAGRVTIGWVTGVYPIRFDAEQALARGDLYVCESEGRVAASGILNQRQVDVYTEGRWAYAAEDRDVFVLHTLTVDPDLSGRGIGRAFVQFYEDTAKALGCTVLRMDTNEKNAAARRLYARLGYREADIVPCAFNSIPDVRLVLLEKRV